MGGSSAETTIRQLVQDYGISRHWKWLPRVAMLGLFFAISLYCVVAGWTLDFFWLAAKGQLKIVAGENVNSLFTTMVADPLRMIYSQTVFLVINLIVLALGVKNGLERFLKTTMPLLFISLIVLVGFSVVIGDFAAGFSFLFFADFSKLNPAVVLMAIGQAFFSLGVGVCVLMTIGAYMDRGISIPRAAAIVVAADGIFALLAGLAIFPVVFAYGLEPAQGAGLVFEVLPVAFSDMPYGQLFAAIFFLLLALAALTSSVTLIEALLASVIDLTGISRLRCLLILGLGLLCFGLGSVFSFNLCASWYPLSAFMKFSTSTFFDIVDYIVSNVLFPLGGIAVSILAGWSLNRSTMRKELGLPEWLFQLWRFAAQVLIPVVIGAVLFLNL